MDSITRQPRLLVKMTSAPETLQLSLADNRSIKTNLRPLFSSIGAQERVGLAAPAQWFEMSAQAQGPEVNAWDLCHQLLTDGFGISGAAPPEFAEPDLEQSWISGTETQHALALARSCSSPENPDADLFFDPANPLWFRDANHSQLEAAQAKAGNRAAAGRVRIAHFDTGYDPDHQSLPQFLRLDLQRNFEDESRLNDASDRTQGFGTNLGHGTGTMGILAGQGIGGATNAEIVPVRVANSVVLFRNSAIAKAFDYVHSLASDPKKRVHVITMSMGGLASQAWAEAVNQLYELGVFIVTAAGNNFGNLPTRNLVYPARFKRVVAACGVMGDGKPYADLKAFKMAGNYGPPQKMGTAMAAFTPNTPWAKLGCPAIVDRDGRGTSSATPQIAAASALWIQANRKKYDAYSQGWMKVEAVRRALFESAVKSSSEKLGQGALQALDALAVQPAAEHLLQKQEPDAADFAFLKIFTGLGAAGDARQRMLELEALQLTQKSHELEQLLAPDPQADPAAIPREKRQQIVDALASAPGASAQLRKALGAEQRQIRTLVPVPAQIPELEKERIERALHPPIPEPPKRTLRVYAYDPLAGTKLDTAAINETVLNIRWESDLAPGPVGDYLEVVDIDPATGCAYAPVDLNHPSILARDGFAPSESDPRFHQQMVYAVAMKTIEHFEHALGRKALWAPRGLWIGGNYEESFVRRLRVYPHAIREANAYYSPDKKALLFGYFPASTFSPGDNLPGGTVFTCLSHDVVAHETTHALLDGLHRRFREPTNKDVFAFHEAFADIVALFQHFTVPEALRHQIAKTRGDLGQQNMLAELAQQFGQATGRYGALRNAVGSAPTSKDYDNAEEAHDLGAVLVAAVFDAFLAIYRRRGEDLIRLATHGTGVLPPGAIPVDLVNRLSQEASRTAGQILNICIRALDYCPPVDITFGDYLRALITADTDLVPDDPLGYRIAFVEGFRRRGIYPRFVRNFSPESLCWQKPEIKLDLGEALAKMKLGWDLNVDRRNAYHCSEENARILAVWLKDAQGIDPALESLGLYRDPKRVSPDVGKGELSGIEVHSVRPVRRVGPDNQQQLGLVIEMTQSWIPPKGSRFRGGCTLVLDLETRQIRYAVRKRVANPERIVQQKSFRAAMADAGLAATYFEAPSRADEPFAMLHR